MGLHEYSRDFVGRCLSDQSAYQVLCDLVEQVGPRPSASPAERKATEIVLESLRSRGFETGIEEFSYPGWQPGPTTVTMHEAGRPSRVLACHPLGWCPGASGQGPGCRRRLRGRRGLPEAGRARPDRARVGGSAPNSRPLHRSRKYGLAVEGGAAGFAFYDARPGGVVPMGSARLEAGLGAIPGVGIGYEDAMRLRRKAAGVELEISSACSGKPAVSCNGVAFKRGRSDEEIVVCGHIDSWFCEGAFDNGSGIAMLLELARLLEPYTLERSLRLIAFGSEEPGILGSKAYLASHADLSRIRCVLNIDSAAIRQGTLTITTNENGRLHQFFEQLGRDLHLELELHRERIHYSDHAPFRERGVPCAQFLAVSPKYAFAHSVFDTLDKLSAECFTLPLVVAGAAIVEAAMQKADFSEAQ